MSALIFDNVSKRYSRRQGAALLASHLKELIGRRQVESNAFYALKRVSFRVEHSQSLAVIGPNGAGKSTLLSLVAGLAFPDEGSVAVNGRVAALLELGSGFHVDLTGRENLRLNAALLGLTRAETVARMDSILDFAGIGDFIDQPLRTYSRGMTVRLAFSVAVNVDPDILIIDEVLAVGDKEFQEKCADRIQRFRRSGKTLLCVSHSPEMLRDLCDEAIWLEHGELQLRGPLEPTHAAYLARHHSGAGA